MAQTSWHVGYIAHNFRVGHHNRKLIGLYRRATSLGAKRHIPSRRYHLDRANAATADLDGDRIVQRTFKQIKPEKWRE